MASRRTRSHSANGRAGHWNGITGNSRPGGCSYISNVRPENRSTLCSVIARLTQETQPAFVTTLKSKAVSESSNAKFICVVTGHPIPQLTWYKDDKQLDRLCGLPKYEIFRNGQSHSLHIYDCTTEDAAIYQASASNSKGIVSCSGVLEVGGMNEFRIHQRYFAKLKQKTDGRNGKENQKPLQAISPERTQKKRRSTVEVFSSVPSSKEDLVPEDLVPLAVEDSKVRLEESAEEPKEKKPAEEPKEEKPAPIAKSKTDNNSGIAKTPFVKKKIKIFPRGERTSDETKESENVKNKVPGGKLLKKKSFEALRSPESLKKHKETDRKCEEKILEKNPTLPSELKSTPEPQRVSKAVPEHLTDPVLAEGALQKRTALPELPQKETKAQQRNSLMESEVTQAPTWMRGNNATVKPEPPPDRGLAATNARLQRKTPWKGAASKEDTRLLFGSSLAKEPQHKKLHSKDSTEGLTVPQKSNAVLPEDQKSQDGLIVKSSVGLIGQSNKNLDDNEVKKPVTPNKKIDEPVTETTAAPKAQQSKDEVTKVTNTNVVPSKNKKGIVEADGQHSKKALILNEQQSRKFQETPQPVARVISVAEMMRAQISTLDSNNLPPGLLGSSAADPLSPKDKTTQERKSEAQVIPETSVDQKSPKANLLEKSNSRKNRTFEEGSSLCPPSAIEPIKLEGNVLDIPFAGSINNYPSVSVNPKEEEDQKSKSVSDGFPGNSVGQMSPKEILEKKGHLGESSMDPVPTIEYNQDCAVIPCAGSSKTYPSVVMNPKEEESQRTTLRTKSDQNGDLGHRVKSVPDIKLDTKTQQGITENTSESLIIEHHPRGCSPGVPNPRFIATDTQENSPHIQGQSMVEQNPDNNILVNSNPKANLLLQKKDGDSSHSLATPQELASGARRKIPSSKDKSLEVKLQPEPQSKTQEVSPPDSMDSTGTMKMTSSSDVSPLSPLLLLSNDEKTSSEKRSPMLGRKKTATVTKTPTQPTNEDTQSEKNLKDRLDPCKAPQVIRKIRSESFADSSGHLKLWCQFFNILTDSAIAWYRNDLEIARIMRSTSDESQVNLAIVQASSKDSGVYKCTITNDYGSDSTEFMLGPNILARISLRGDLGVGEEIEMAPLVFSKGVADSGVWGNKLFGRIMLDQSCIGEGSGHKVWRAKVIYGLEPVFESGHTCVLKVKREIAYGGKEEHGLTERNLELVKQQCKIQNLAREYCKIFSAEARIIENFGPSLEVIPVHLMYRPANTIPYATVEADLAGVYQKYVELDHMGKIEMKATSDVGLKCCALQHWIFQWTSRNLLITRLEGVDAKITNIGITVRSTGHQGLQIEGKPEVLEAFVSHHQCNYFCGLLGLRSLKVLDSLTTPTKSKGSKSPLLQRKNQASGSGSPQTSRRATGSPRVSRKSQQEGNTNTLKTAVEVSI
ncbi:alpha-protein kinase 3-like [Stigmatopora nigra]